MKPAMNPKLVAWTLGFAGAALVAISQLDHITWQGVMAAVGGALLGILKLGPDMIRLSDLPPEIRESVRPSKPPKE